MTLNKIINRQGFFIFVPRKGRFVPMNIAFGDVLLGVHDRPFLFLIIINMSIKEKHVLEFQRLYKETFKEELSYDEAYSQCMDLIVLGKIVYSPIYKKDIKDLNEKRNGKN
jgi:hypothetical protein